MTSEQAMKITLAVYVLGLGATIYTGRKDPFASNFKRIWGFTILAIGGSILSDVAPKAVGPFMILVGIGLLYSQKTGLGGLFGAAGKASSGSSSNTVTPQHPGTNP